MKLTDWFPADVKPVHVGVYETMSPPFVDEKGWFAFWSGGEWCSAHRHAYTARYDLNPSRWQERKWRGLAEKPECRFLVLRLLNAAIAADARKDFAMACLLTEAIEHLEKDHGCKPTVQDFQR